MAIDLATFWQSAPFRASHSLNRLYANGFYGRRPFSVPPLRGYRSPITADRPFRPLQPGTAVRGPMLWFRNQPRQLPIH
jgi:hypothetical protein